MDIHRKIVDFVGINFGGSAQLMKTLKVIKQPITA
jgi:hypothetical protein